MFRVTGQKILGRVGTHFFSDISFSSPEPLTHGERCQSWDVCPQSSTIFSKDISLTTCWILTKLGRNGHEMALFDSCSNGFSPLHIKVTQAKIDFRDENFKNLHLKPEGLEP